MSFCISHILVWFRRTVARSEREPISDTIANKGNLIRRRTVVRLTHLYPTFLALDAAGPRLSVCDHLRSSELYSLVVALVTAHCPGFGALPSSVSFMMNKGRERGEWLEAKGMAGARRYGRMWLGDYADPDSRQGDSCSLRCVYRRQGCTSYKNFCIFFSPFQYQASTPVLFNIARPSESENMLSLVCV